MGDREEYNSPSTDFDLAQFISDWSDLFVVMGVFAALAVYISDISSEGITNAPEVIQGGFVGSLVLTSLIGLLIFKKIYGKFDSFDEFVRGIFHLKNIELIIFFLAFSLILQSLFSRASANHNIVLQLISVISFITGLGVFLHVFHYISTKLLSQLSDHMYLVVVLSIGYISFEVIDKLIDIYRSLFSQPYVNTFTSINLISISHLSTWHFILSLELATLLILSIHALLLILEISGILFRTVSS
ncbi:hypothetical protein NGM10_04380 [Halorussus salilacus]|uniref:hypothetical protein n=1 Tax=Halorussus salilacus TaxID=2953750 RepID=UPI0020A14F10|nr:hypothetical protein [Halorussus salilacus]USZ68978.1 hypothetical protein NGM10_04380 [Halorussus salilacus]